MAITIDSHTPAIVYAASASSIQSPSFAPPANSLVLVSVSGVYTNGMVTAVTNTGAAMDTPGWTQLVGLDANTNDECVEIWGAYTTPAHASMTVTASFTNDYYVTLGVIVLQGADPNQVGQVGYGQAYTSGGTPAATVNGTGAGSWVFGVGCAYFAPTSSFAVSGGQTATFNGHLFQHQETSPGYFDMWTQATSAPTSGGTVTLSLTQPTGTEYGMAAIEILPLGGPRVVAISESAIGSSDTAIVLPPDRNIVKTENSIGTSEAIVVPAVSRSLVIVESNVVTSEQIVASALGLFQASPAETSIISTETLQAAVLDRVVVSEPSQGTSEQIRVVGPGAIFRSENPIGSTEALKLAVLDLVSVAEASISNNELINVFTGAASVQQYALRIREKAPLRLSVLVTTPDGRNYRWGVDDTNPRNVPNSLSFSTVMPGGFEQGSCVLQRDPGSQMGIGQPADHPQNSSSPYPDLEEFSKITVCGVGGTIVHQGRLEQLPDTGGIQAQVTPTWIGYQAHLDDDNSAREIFVDRNISTWQGPSVQRQIQWLQTAQVVTSSPSVAPDFTTGYPSLDASMSGSWTQSQAVEGWYDARGITIAKLYAAWETNGQFQLSGGNAFGAGIFLANEDTAQNYDSLLFTASPSSYTLSATTTTRDFGLLQFWNDTVPGGKDGVNFDLYWTDIGVYGNHGLTIYADPQGGTNAGCVKASDVIAYALQKWCPKISFTTGVNGTIQPSTFLIPQLAFLDPTTVSAMVKQAIVYELLDYAVWESPVREIGPMFYLNPRDTAGRKWHARIGPAQLQETGPNMARIWNGVVVQFTDVSGITRTYGPPGSGMNQTDASLQDLDPQNPANEAGIRRWALVTMGTTTFPGALAVGQNFLKEQKILDTSGQATLTGHVQDDHGIYWPSFMVRAGDQIAFVDANDPSYRRIVHTSYDDTTKANAIQLDQPPDSLNALLQRMSIVLAPYGM